MRVETPGRGFPPPRSGASSLTPLESPRSPMSKITFVGAGSTVFAKNLLGDILSVPELADSDIALFDIDAERLRTSEAVAAKTAAAVGASPMLTATTDRAQALDGADHVITMFQIGGFRPSTVVDFEVPK